MRERTLHHFPYTGLVLPTRLMVAGRLSWCLIPVTAIAVVSFVYLSQSEPAKHECDDETSFAQSILVATRLAGPSRQTPLTASVGSLREPADLIKEDAQVLLHDRERPPLFFQSHQDPVRVEDILAAEDDAAGLEPIPDPSEPQSVVFPEAMWHPWGQTNRYSQPIYRHHKDNRGINHFFESTSLLEWCVFFGVMAMFTGIQYYTMEWPSKHLYHGLALFMWFGLAALSNGLVAWRFGSKVASDWFSGYMLELVFSIENIFVFHIVVRGFRVPRRHAEKALCIVVFAQIIFEMIFFMGLAYAIRASNALPYILGVWLIYVGYQAGSEHNHEDVNFKDTLVYEWSSWLLGERLFPHYRKNDLRLLRVRGEKKSQCTMLFLATIALLLVDFMLEVDVVLTKIEEIDNHFISFSSSAVAAFAVPELFFVCRDLFARFYLMKFGICFVLVFFGMQLLTHELVEISTIIQIIITIVVMIICVILSVLLPAKSDLDADAEDFDATSSDVDQLPVSAKK